MNLTAIGQQPAKRVQGAAGGVAIYGAIGGIPLPPTLPTKLMSEMLYQKGSSLKLLGVSSGFVPEQNADGFPWEVPGVGVHFVVNTK